METKLGRIASKSANTKRPEFTSLYHLINKEMLMQCHRELDGSKAVGIDEVTKREYNFCALTDTFSEQFDIVIAMDNALPHMLTGEALETAVRSITGQIKQGGIFVASIRDYDSLLDSKPPYSPPYIHKTEKGQRVSFQTWVWNGDNYQLTQYIIDDEENLQIGKFVCEYRATRREELTNLLLSSGCSQVIWKFPEESGFYQPIVIARK